MKPAGTVKNVPNRILTEDEEVRISRWIALLLRLFSPVVVRDIGISRRELGRISLGKSAIPPLILDRLAGAGNITIKELLTSDDVLPHVPEISKIDFGRFELADRIGSFAYRTLKATGSLTRMAQHLMVPEKTIRGWIIGRNTPPLLVFLNLARLGGRSPDAIIKTTCLKPMVSETFLPCRNSQEIEFSSRISGFLAEFIKTQKVRKSELAHNMGVSTTTMNRWLEGVKLPSVFNLYLLCIHTHTSIEDLFDVLLHEDTSEWLRFLKGISPQASIFSPRVLRSAGFIVQSNGKSVAFLTRYLGIRAQSVHELLDRVRVTLSDSRCVLVKPIFPISTLHAILYNIRKRYPSFSLSASTGLRLTMDELTSAVKKDRSVVFRLINRTDLYLPERGVLPLKSFVEFTSETAAATKNILMHRIQSIISSKEINLSDSSIAAILKDEGFSIARRTVAKYRSLFQAEASHSTTDHSARNQETDLSSDSETARHDPLRVPKVVLKGRHRNIIAFALAEEQLRALIEKSEPFGDLEGSVAMYLVEMGYEFSRSQAQKVRNLLRIEIHPKDDFHKETFTQFLSDALAAKSEESRTPTDAQLAELFYAKYGNRVSPGTIRRQRGKLGLARRLSKGNKHRASLEAQLAEILNNSDPVPTDEHIVEILSKKINAPVSKGFVLAARRRLGIRRPRRASQKADQVQENLRQLAAATPGFALLTDRELIQAYRLKFGEELTLDSMKLNRRRAGFPKKPGFADQKHNAASVREYIRRIVEGEEKETPLKDDAISKLLQKNHGLHITPLRVTKHRRVLGIESAGRRKRARTAGT